MSTYIRYETSHYQSFNVNSVVAEYKDIHYKDIHYLIDFQIDETIDMEKRCLTFMQGYRCHKGDFCDRVHRLPREDKFLCRLFKEGKCNREASHCWYSHPFKKVNKFETEEDAPLLVPGVGHIMSYLRNKGTKPTNNLKK